MNIKDIAALAHVSPATVSKALNNGYGVDPETAEHIRRLAEQSGYLRQKKKTKQENRKRGFMRVAILCPEINSTYYAGFAAALSAELKERGSAGIFYSYDFDEGLRDELIHQCLNDPKIDALVCLNELKEKLETEIPIIAFGGHEAHSRIRLQGGDFAKKAAEYMIRRGKRRIAFVGERLTEFKHEAFENTLKAHGLTPHCMLASSERFERAGEQNAKELLRRGDLPDGIVCAYDEIAFGVIDTLQKAGVRIPEDVAVVGLNDIPSAAYCFGGVTSVGYDKSVIRKVVEDLLADEKNGRFVPREYETEFYVAERKSS